MKQAGKTIVVVEQNVRFGLRLATHGVVMESGRVLLTGDAGEVRANPEMADLFFGGSAHADGKAKGNAVAAPATTGEEPSTA
jgi:branched-chain amino acid transport system ATP-binding protein